MYVQPLLTGSEPTGSSLGKQNFGDDVRRNSRYRGSPGLGLVYPVLFSGHFECDRRVGPFIVASPTLNHVHTYQRRSPADGLQPLAERGTAPRCQFIMQ